jgi:hypothetical protein
MKNIKKIIPFNIKYKEKVESGQYKVITEDGYDARIISWDMDVSGRKDIVALVKTSTGNEILRTYYSDGTMVSNGKMRLFLVCNEVVSFIKELNEMSEEQLHDAYARVIKWHNENFTDDNEPLLCENTQTEINKAYYNAYRHFIDISYFWIRDNAKYYLPNQYYGSIETLASQYYNAMCEILKKKNENDG